MSNEVLVCLSYGNQYYLESSNPGNIIMCSSGKQYCWMKESDYNKLKVQELLVTVGFSHTCDTPRRDNIEGILHVNKIEDQLLINAVSNLGPNPFNSCRFYIGKEIRRREEGSLFVKFNEDIKYEDYPSNSSCIIF